MMVHALPLKFKQCDISGRSETLHTFKYIILYIYKYTSSYITLLKVKL